MGFLAALLIGALVGAAAGGIVAALSSVNPDIEDKTKGISGPRSEYGDKVPYVFGTVQIDSPICIYAGNSTLVEKPWSSEFDDKVAPHYQMPIDLLLCKRIFHNDLPLGEVTLRKIWYGDNILWDGTNHPTKLNWSGTLLSADPNRNNVSASPGGKTDLFANQDQGWWKGGASNEQVPEIIGNISARFTSGQWVSGYGLEQVRFYVGNGNEVINQYIKNTIQDVELGYYPAYNNLVRLVFEEFYWGKTGSIKRISVELSHSIPAPELNDHVGIDSNGQVNPISVLYHLLTNDEFFGNSKLPPIDIDSFKAAHTKCEEDYLKMSYFMTSKIKAYEFLENILNFVDGYLYLEPNDGKIHINLLRHDYQDSDLPVYDESIVHKDGPSFSKNGWKGTCSEAKITFDLLGSAPNGMTAKSVAVAKDNALSEEQGIVEVSEENSDFAKIARVANKLAARKLSVSNTPLISVKIPFLRHFNGSKDPTTLRPGDVFIFKYGPLSIEKMYVRVSDVDLGRFSDNKVVITGIQDRFEPHVTIGDPEPPDVSIPDPTYLTIDKWRVITAPLAIAKIGMLGNGMVNTVKIPTVLPPSDTPYSYITLGENFDRFLILVKKPGGAVDSHGKFAYELRNVETGAALESKLGKYTPHGVLEEAIPAPWLNGGTGHYEIKVTVSADDIAHLAPSDENGLIDKRNLILINGELMAIKTWSYNYVTNTLQGSLERVLLDSDWFDCIHEPGDDVWFLNLNDVEGMKSRMTNHYPSALVTAVRPQSCANPNEEQPMIDAAKYNTAKYQISVRSNDTRATNLWVSNTFAIQNRANLPLPPRRLYITEYESQVMGESGKNHLLPENGRIGRYNAGGYFQFSLALLRAEELDYGHANPIDDRIRKHGQTWPNGEPTAKRDRFEYFYNTAHTDSPNAPQTGLLDYSNYIYQISWKMNSNINAGTWVNDMHMGVYYSDEPAPTSPYTLFIAVRSCHIIDGGSVDFFNKGWKFNVGRPSIYKFDMTHNG